MVDPLVGLVEHHILICDPDYNRYYTTLCSRSLGPLFKGQDFLDIQCTYICIVNNRVAGPG